MLGCLYLVKRSNCSLFYRVTCSCTEGGAQASVRDASVSLVCMCRECLCSYARVR
jgi:hypothetical protein